MLLKPTSVTLRVVGHYIMPMHILPPLAGDCLESVLNCQSILRFLLPPLRGGVSAAVQEHPLSLVLLAGLGQRDSRIHTKRQYPSLSGEPILPSPVLAMFLHMQIQTASIEHLDGFAVEVSSTNGRVIEFVGL